MLSRNDVLGGCFSVLSSSIIPVLDRDTKVQVTHTHAPLYLISGDHKKENTISLHWFISYSDQLHGKNLSLPDLKGTREWYHFLRVFIGWQNRKLARYSHEMLPFCVRLESEIKQNVLDKSAVTFCSKAIHGPADNLFKRDVDKNIKLRSIRCFFYIKTSYVEVCPPFTQLSWNIWQAVNVPIMIHG